MKYVGRRWFAGWLGLVVVGTGACTHDFRVRRADPAPASTALSVQQCWQALRHDPAQRAAATERLLALYGPALLAARDGTAHVPLASGQTFTIALRRGSGPGGASPADYVALEPTDGFVVDGVDHFSRTSGEGVPVAGRLRPVQPVNSPGLEPTQAVPGLVRALTVVASVSRQAPPAVTLSLYDPHSAARGMAADYTTPVALELAQLHPQQRALLGLISGGDYFASTGLYPLDTPTPDKTPLVLVHGLISSPGDFHHLYNNLMADDTVRRRYQVWVFYYPTSLPVVYAAMLLREDVDRFIHQLDPGGTHPALHRAVLVGHSMGGLLCRFAISDGGDSFYGRYFNQPLGKLALSPNDRALAQRLFYSSGSANVAQVVFIATPQHGSRLVGGPLGGFGRALLHMPSALRRRLHAVLVRNQQAVATKGHLQPSSSLDSMSPKGIVITTINNLTMRPGVRLHSILGDRGRGGPPEKSSDGVVPYESSHLPQAESELIVPAGHTGTLKRPETSDELIRILRG